MLNLAKYRSQILFFNIFITFLPPTVFTLHSQATWILPNYQKLCKANHQFNNATESITGNLDVQSLIFPANGEYKIEKNSKILFHSPCVYDNKLTPEWLDPKTWHKSPPINSATPTINTIPCQYDVVTFPDMSNAYVNLPEVSVTVGRVEINGQTYDHAQFQEYLTNAGLMHFPRRDYQQFDEIVRVRECTHCACQNFETEFEGKHLQHLVCSKMGACATTLCLNAVRPFGYCCAFCGASYELYGNVSNLHDVTSFVRGKLAHFNVTFNVSRVTLGDKAYVQLTLIPVEYTDDFFEFFGSLRAWLLRDDHLNIQRVVLTQAGVYYNPRSEINPVKFSIILFVLTGITMLTVIVTYYPPFCNRFNWHNPLESFLFAKFENTNDGDLRFDVADVINDREFENPLYTNGRGSDRHDVGHELKELQSEICTVVSECDVGEVIRLEDTSDESH